MSLISSIFDLLFLGPTLNIIIFIFRSLDSVGIPGALGFSVILMTVFIRLLVWPLMGAQLKSVRKMTELKPHLDTLKKKHGSDKQALAQAQMALYKEHGVNPAGGCLPLLIQFPFLIALYQAIFALFNGDAGLQQINNLLYVQSWRLSSPPDPTFFGLNISMKPADFGQIGVFVLAIPVITALLQLTQSKMMMAEKPKIYLSDSPKETKEKAGIEDSMAAMQGQMLFLMPLMIGYFAFQFPIALALYWNTLTIVGIVQQYLISGWGGLKDWVKLLKR